MAVGKPSPPDLPPISMQPWANARLSIERFLRGLHAGVVTTIKLWFSDSDPSTIEIGDAADPGTEDSWARPDHVHAVGTPGAPPDVTTAAATGSSKVPARSDHVHKLGIVTTKGDSITHNGTGPVREAVGANDTILMADSTQVTGRAWVTVAAAAAKVLTAKGDLLSRDGSTPVRVAVGANGLELVANSSATPGIQWGPVVVSPAQITADQNDYAPGSPGVWRLSSDAPWNVTGILAGQDGQAIRIVNVGANAITLKHQNAGSSAANRLICTGAADIALAADEGALGWYDLTTARWRLWKL